MSMVLDVQEQHQPEATSLPCADRSSKAKLLSKNW